MLYKKNPDMEFIETDENGVVVFDPVSGDSCILNDIGCSILHALEQAAGQDPGASPEAVAHCLSLEYDAPIAQIEADVQEFLSALLAQGVIQICK